MSELTKVRNPHGDERVVVWQDRTWRVGPGETVELPAAAAAEVVQLCGFELAGQIAKKKATKKKGGRTKTAKTAKTETPPSSPPVEPEPES